MEEKQNNLSTFIGLGLIFLLLYLWMQYTAPDKKVEDAKGKQNTTAIDSGKQTAEPAPAQAPISEPAMPDSAQSALNMARYGAFAAAASGKESDSYLENEFMRVRFTNKGGRIREVLLKKYDKINSDSANNDIKGPVHLLADTKNRFEYQIPMLNTANGSVNTKDLYFTAQQTGQTIRFRANTTDGGYFEQVYTLSPDNYELDYQLNFNGMQASMPKEAQLKLDWVNYLDKLERNQTYERTMSSVYFKTAEGSPDYCNCRKDATEKLGEKPVEWMAHSNQFFNTALIARNFSFQDFVGETQMLTDKDPDLKLLHTTALIPVKNAASGNIQMTLYTGPNEFDRLRSYGHSLEDIIPFGSSIFGSINRWVIHPIFEFLSRFFGNQGIIILILTLIVKLLVYPLTYRMVYSQAKMSALKPQIDALRKKFGDDQQAMGSETMRLYSEFGVNPLGSCFPIVLQMPIWFALYRFFPAAIEFRQAGFLWATDLSSYDIAFKLPFMMPGFGNHISAFTLIWVATTLWYTWYSMKQMDQSTMSNPAMKYMQYFMPIMFMFFFNSFASGLTTYLCFSNILNIGQTVVTKRFFINHEKINEQLHANRAKPKKTGGWRDRFEQAMKEQQRVQTEKQKQAPKKK